MRSTSRAAGGLAAGLLAVLFARAAWAQPAAGPAQPHRPRVGLALGGGSARGFTHLGVIKWLDEHRVPVDVIGGTSMGAIVGGSLAIGMSPDETWALVASMDWARLLAPDSPFRHKTFRRKEDSREFPSMLEFGLKNGFSLPGGLSTAEHASLFVDRIALPFYGVTRFDDLPIPFRCVAVDLRTSEQVVLDSGHLGDALRATMAIPGLFMPVHIGDMVLVDGGVLNNVPADVVKNMGADFIIAVDVGRDLNTPKQSDTLLRVLGETLDVVMRASARKALEAADLVIRPDIRGMTGIDFSRVSEFVDRGYAAAESQRDRLLPLALSEADYQAHLAARAGRRRTAVPSPSFLAVEGVAGSQAAVIRRKMRHHIGRPLDGATMERDIALLTGSERYEAISYRLTESAGRVGLLIVAREKAHAPPYLLGALDLQNAESSTVAAAIRGRLTFFDVLTPGSETRLDLGVGQTTRAGAEWLLAVGSQGLFVAPRVSYTRQHINLFLDNAFVSEYQRVTHDVAVDVGYGSGRSFELRAGYARERVSGEVRLGDPILPEVSGAQGYWRARAVYDAQSSPVVPDRGVYARAELRRFTETVKIKEPETLVSSREPDHLMIGEVRASYFRTAGPKGRVFAAGAGGWSFHDQTTLNSFVLGGPLELSALRRDELRGSNFVLLSAGYFHEVARIIQGAAGRLYAGGWVENGSAFERVQDAHVRTNFSGGFVMETPIGPAFLVGGVGTDGKARLYLGLGPVFRR